MNPHSNGKSIFIVSGEESGDLHGAALMKSLKRMIPGLYFSGMGGTRMKDEGLFGLDSREVSVVGIVEVLNKLLKILKSMRALKGDLRTDHFDAVVLIDFPDFNLRLAKEAKRLGIPVIYYISPQVWAWRKGRLAKIARLVDKMLVVFPFEVSLYRQVGVDVEYVGHPLADIVKCDLAAAEARTSLSIGPNETAIALLPGSRTGEVKKLLGPMVKAAGLISLKLKGARFLLPAAGSIEDKLLQKYLKSAGAGLPNIVAERKVVPELIQDEATPEKTAGEVLSMLEGSKRDAILEGYDEIKRNLGRGGATERVAKSIYNTITNLHFLDYNTSPDMVRKT
ncbi:MAG: lipid-A-disaccharide synthase [Deltaproteobacteria bacterium]|nr:lipid-A-disaccharide synthase [Deltaproteobacteria bacterium]